MNENRTLPPLALNRFGVATLQQAKPGFSEMVRRVKDGPQTVTVHGKPSVVVVSADDFERLQPQSGSDLIDLIACA